MLEQSHWLGSHVPWRQGFGGAQTHPPAPLP
jgi:hypothetical protein